VYLRTAISVEAGGWAHFDYVKMPDYRWGIFLEPHQEGRTIGFGDVEGQPVWDEVPGEHRNSLRRIIVTQADTEPASVEQQRLLGKTAPSLYDLRNIFQVNVEEGRHLWAMVYLLHRYFGRDGREEAEELLARRSGSGDKPRARRKCPSLTLLSAVKVRPRDECRSGPIVIRALDLLEGRHPKAQAIRGNAPIVVRAFVVWEQEGYVHPDQPTRLENAVQLADRRLRVRHMLQDRPAHRRVEGRVGKPKILDIVVPIDRRAHIVLVDTYPV